MEYRSKIRTMIESTPVSAALTDLHLDPGNHPRSRTRAPGCLSQLVRLTYQPPDRQGALDHCSLETSVTAYMYMTLGMVTTSPALGWPCLGEGQHLTSPPTGIVGVLVVCTALRLDGTL